MKQTFGGWASVGIGAICLLAGLIWGLVGSHQISYQNSQQGVRYLAGVGEKSGNVYIHAEGSSDYFVALSGDFSPAITQSVVDNAAAFSFIARPDTTSIDLTVSGSTITEAHKIEQLVLQDTTGATIATYTTAEYTTNPHGVFTSVWGNAVWLVVLGVVLVGGGIFEVRRKKNTSFSIGGAPAYQPAPAAYVPAPPADPYAQSYRGLESNPYPQQPQE